MALIFILLRVLFHFLFLFYLFTFLDFALFLVFWGVFQAFWKMFLVFWGGVSGFLESAPGFGGMFRVLGGVPGCSGVPVFLEVLHAERCPNFRGLFTQRVIESHVKLHVKSDAQRQINFHLFVTTLYDVLESKL